MSGGEGGLESKGEGSWFQASDLSGWGFATMNKTSFFQVSGFFLLQQKGLRLDIISSCSCKKYKDKILCVQVKNKPCIIYKVMHLIPWKQYHGSKTRDTLIFLGPPRTHTHTSRRLYFYTVQVKIKNPRIILYMKVRAIYISKQPMGDYIYKQPA